MKKSNKKKKVKKGKDGNEREAISEVGGTSYNDTKESDNQPMSKSTGVRSLDENPEPIEKTAKTQ